MITLERIHSRLDRNEPARIPVGDRPVASVAMVLRGDGEDLDVLFIERARHGGDPWSGHMAFPGGRVEALDANAAAAAVRETDEEVGLSLESARYLGRLDDLEGRHAGTGHGLIITGHVYHHESPGPLKPNYEVEEAFWFPLASLHAPDRHVEFRHPRTGTEGFPGILVGEPDRHVVWGLTYRFLEVFWQAVDSPLPDRWEGLR